MSDANNRGTISLEDAPILSQTAYPGNQYIIRLAAPDCARHATPGSFAHVTCAPSVPMRRPLSLMCADAEKGWVEFLYKSTGRGLALLANREVGEFVSVLGPIGQGFETDPARPLILAIGGGVGIPPIYFLADQLKGHSVFELFVLMGSEVPFPFDLATSSQAIDGIPAEVNMKVTDLAERGITSRLASNVGFSGCFKGLVTELARNWLTALSTQRLTKVQIVSCGPMAMLEATAALAREFEVPCQVAVEEYMACGVGGCAGCTILVQTPKGPAMKRVCVDGPVFDAATIFTG